MTEAVTAKGTRLYVKIDQAWTEIKEVSAVPEVGQSTEKIDVTHLTSDMKEYVKDIPDWSSDLEFTMNAMPSGSTDSNLDLILGLDQDASYEWKITYAQLKEEATIKAQFSYRIGAASVSTKQDFILTLVPQSGLTFENVTATQTLTYEDGQEAVA